MARTRLSQGTRQKLLEEGVAAFLANGYHGTGLKEVLDRVKVPKGSFYNYFSSKEEFGVATIEHYSDCFAAKLDAALEASSNPLLGLRKFFRQLMTDFKAAGYGGGCLIANLGGELESSEPVREALSRAFRAWRDRVRDALKEGQAQGLVRRDIPAGELADLLVESWEGAVIRMKIERDLKPLRQCLKRLLDDYFQA